MMWRKHTVLVMRGWCWDKGNDAAWSLLLALGGVRKKRGEEGADCQSQDDPALITSARFRRGEGCATSPQKLGLDKKKSKYAVPTAQDIDDAKSWSAAYNWSCQKYYYYHKGTKKTHWDMLSEYHAVHSNGVMDIAGSKENFGLMGLRRKLASTKESNNASPSPNADGNHNQARGYYGVIEITSCLGKNVVWLKLHL
jgi:hypothetical protein